MLDGLVTYFSERKLDGLLRDLLDVAIVYYACYRALLVMRGTRAVQVGVGLAMLLALYVVARLLELMTVLTVMGALLSSFLLIIVVVFQNDIRRGLQRIGSQAIFSRFTRGPETRVIDEVVDAATELARHRIGALVAFEQDANLDEFVGTHKGHVIDAAVTTELLVSLFVPEGVNKLHDGAVIIRHLRIAKAGVFFPMPEQRIVDSSFGSRHRAALGITEETDAVVVVVSEERGTISFCFNGNIASNLDGPKLRTLLEAVFSPKAAQKKRSASRRSTTTAGFPAAEPASTGAEISAHGVLTDEPAGRSRAGVEATRSPVEPARGEAILPEPDDHADSERAPARLRRGLESDPPPPLRTRTGLEDSVIGGGGATRIPRAAKVPAPIRTVLGPREPSVIHTPVSTPPGPKNERDSSGESGEESR
ncbi:MAG TPA: diadenylate cyclase CdaA [Polyangiaceae bacterium]